MKDVCIVFTVLGLVGFAAYLAYLLVLAGHPFFAALLLLIVSGISVSTKD